MDSKLISEQLTVTIVDSDQPIETRRCRLVRLPNGAQAALWRGLAWPVGAGDRIDIAGPAYPLVTQDPAPSPLFGLIEGAEEAWLVLDGPVTVRDAAAGALRRAGVTVLRSGPWLGDPVDGVVGTGFICFIRPQVGDLRDKVAKILVEILAPSSEKFDPADKVHALTVELADARAAIARLQMSQLEARPAVADDNDNELASVRQENAALLQEIVELHSQLAEAALRRPEPSRAAGRLQNEISTLLETIRPDLHLLRDSLTVLAGEFSDRRSLYRAIMELDTATLGHNWKRIQGARGWWERHVSNGQDDSGRIYARHVQGRWDLLVSHKSQQARDVSWLGNQPA